MMPSATPTQSASEIWCRHYSTPAGHRYWPNEELVRAVGNQRFARIIEVGCGNGANLWYLAEHGDSVVGIDGCAEATLAADGYMRRRMVDDHVVVTQGDIQKMPIADGAADAIIDIMVSQHVPWPDHVAVYAEYRRVLRTGGWLFRYGLARGTVLKGARMINANTYDELPELFPSVGPVALPHTHQLHSALKSAGFDIQATRFVARSYDVQRKAVYSVVEAIAI